MTAASTDIARFEQESNRYYHRNFSAGLIHGIFFQMSAAFGSIHTVLPAFVTLLTPSTIAVGLMAAIQDFGEIVPQLFTAYLIEGQPRKKKYLLAVITIRWLSWGLLAWLTYQYALTNPLFVLAVLIILFGLFSLAGGIGTVVYADIFARAIPANRRGRFTGARQIGGFALAILAGWIVKNILDNETAFPFPVNYSLIFLLSTITLAVAFTGFALIREPVYPVKRQSESLTVMLRRALILVRINPNFRRLLFTRAILGVGIGLAPFYVVHAGQNQSASSGIIGVYLSAQMAGAAFSNILWAWLADTRGNKMVIIGTLASSGLASMLALALPVIAPAAYVLVFILLGAMLSGMKLGYSNFILEMAEPEMRATCVALQNTLIAPITLLPLLAGVLIEGTSFALVFGIQTLLMVGGLVIALNLLDPRSDEGGACITNV